MFGPFEDIQVNASLENRYEYGSDVHEGTIASIKSTQQIWRTCIWMALQDYQHLLIKRFFYN